jgi:uncharacterized protein YndB with AHSA1/START domain
MSVVLIILAVVAVLLVVVATRPNTFRIERRTSIAAPAGTVFQLINDFHQWTRWSPWEGRDPNLQRTYDGAPAGVGAVYSWVGIPKVGSGRMTVMESKPSERIGIKLEFFKPWEATNQADFIITPGAGGVDVTWAMSGRHNFTTKAFSVVMSMDKLVGKDFEQGLAQLKRIAEDQARTGPTGTSTNSPSPSP